MGIPTWPILVNDKHSILSVWGCRSLPGKDRESLDDDMVRELARATIAYRAAERCLITPHSPMVSRCDELDGGDLIGLTALSGPQPTAVPDHEPPSSWYQFRRGKSQLVNGTKPQSFHKLRHKEGRADPAALSEASGRLDSVKIPIMDSAPEATADKSRRLSGKTEEGHAETNEHARRSVDKSDASVASERALVRKLDLYLIPLIMSLYLFSFVDRY